MNHYMKIRKTAPDDKNRLWAGHLPLVTPGKIYDVLDIKISASGDRLLFIDDENRIREADAHHFTVESFARINENECGSCDKADIDVSPLHTKIEELEKALDTEKKAHSVTKGQLTKLKKEAK